MKNLSEHPIVLILNGNNYNEGFPNKLVIGEDKSAIAGLKNGFENFTNFLNNQEKPVYGFLGYDLKNEIEKLQSKNLDSLTFPNYFFFNPKNEISFHSLDDILSFPNNEPSSSSFQLKHRVCRNSYLETVKKIQRHIKKGDVYELNYCMEFYIEDITINPFLLYKQLNTISPTPYSVFLKNNDHYLIGASPELFLKKEGDTILSKPIKGTIKREEDPILDAENKEKLRHSEKERAENLMIVDLVRNDLAKSAIPGSIHVDELFEIYSFKQVHQMISTVSAKADPGISIPDIIKNAFPMGSMTGAPKIRAMELIEQYESTKRGLYSGSVGYINPNGDFEWNVVIRSILYNAQKRYLSFHVGSAITYDANPEQEYEECLLKAKAICEVLGASF